MDLDKIRSFLLSKNYLPIITRLAANQCMLSLPNNRNITYICDRKNKKLTIKLNDNTKNIISPMLDYSYLSMIILDMDRRLQYINFPFDVAACYDKNGQAIEYKNIIDVPEETLDREEFLLNFIIINGSLCGHSDFQEYAEQCNISDGIEFVSNFYEWIS